MTWLLIAAAAADLVSGLLDGTVGGDEHLSDFLPIDATPEGGV